MTEENQHLEPASDAEKAAFRDGFAAGEAAACRYIAEASCRYIAEALEYGVSVDAGISKWLRLKAEAIALAELEKNDPSPF